MSVSHLELILQPYVAVYFPGQRIEGFVKATVPTAMKSRAVTVTCKGKSKCSWTEQIDEYEDVTYSAKEIHFKLTSEVWSNSESSEKKYIKMPSGNHSWPFAFELPKRLPSSFEATHGYIRYKLKAEVDIPMGVDKKTSTYFSVNAPVDLNYNDQAKTALVVNKSASSCFIPCARGISSIQINCPRSGAVIGENFKLRGEITNNGISEIEDTEVIMYQEVKYFAEGQKKSNEYEVSRIKRGPISPGDSDVYADVPFKILAVAPCIKDCSIMKINYILEFRTKFGSCTSVSEKKNFTIGTVPFVVEGSNAIIQTMPMMAAIPAVNSSVELPQTSNIETQKVDESNEASAPPPPAGFVPVGEGEIPQPVEGIMPQQIGVPAMPQVMTSHVPGQPLLIGQPLPHNNPYPIKHTPGSENCYLSRHVRSRYDKKCELPNYISYHKIMN